jgi:HK97 family phage portal protein
MKLRNLFRASTAVPDGPRPSMTLWWDPGGVRPPVSWWPASGEFQTHWDMDLVDAMAVPGYWRARLLISQAIGGMPLGSWQSLVKDDPTPPVLVAPNPDEDRCATVAAWVADLLDHGNAVGIIDGWARDGTAASSVTPWPARDTAVVRTDGRIVYRFACDGQIVSELPAAQVFHAKGVLPYPGALRGLGILEAGMSTVARVAAQDRYATNAFATGTPSGLLRVKDPDLQAGSPDDPAGYATAHGIKKTWQENIATGDIAVLSDLVDFTPLGWTPTDAQMIEARQMSIVDIANLFALDPYWLGSAQTSAPYQNVQDAAVQLVRFALAPWITALETQFSRLLTRGHEARFNRDSLLRDQQSVRVQTEIALVNAGIVTVDEVRAWEGLLPLEGLTLEEGPGNATVTVLSPATSDTDTNEPAIGG